MAKKAAVSTALQNMSKADLAKLDRSLKDLMAAKDDAGVAVARFYKNKIKKPGIHEDAYKLANKLNALGSPAKVQAFLVDFDKLRQMYGWDDQKNLFEEDKTAPQKADEKKAAAKADKPAKADKNAPKSEPAERAKKNGHSDEPKGKRVARRGAALFDESDKDDERPDVVN